MNFTQMSLNDGSVVVHGVKSGAVSGITYSNILEWIRIQTEGSLVVTSTLIIDDKVAIRRVTTSDIGGNSESIFSFGSLFTGYNRISIRGETNRREKSIDLTINGDIDGAAINEVIIDLPYSKKEGMRYIKNNIDASSFAMGDGSKMPEITVEPVFSEIGKIVSTDIDSSITEYISSLRPESEVDTCSLGCTAAAEACAVACSFSGVLIGHCAVLCITSLSACLVYCALQTDDPKITS